LKLHKKGIEVDFTKIDSYKLRGGTTTELVQSSIENIVFEGM